MANGRKCKKLWNNCFMSGFKFWNDAKMTLKCCKIAIWSWQILPIYFLLNLNLQDLSNSNLITYTNPEIKINLWRNASQKKNLKINSMLVNLVFKKNTGHGQFMSFIAQFLEKLDVCGAASAAAATLLFCSANKLKTMRMSHK